MPINTGLIEGATSAKTLHQTLHPMLHLNGFWLFINLMQIKHSQRGVFLCISFVFASILAEFHLVTLVTRPNHQGDEVKDNLLRYLNN